MGIGEVMKKNAKKSTKAKSSKSKPRIKVDYDKMEAAYITAKDIKMKDFAAEYGITANQLYKVRKKNKWDEKRKAYNKEIAKEMIEEGKKQEIVDYLEIKKRLDKSMDQMSKLLVDITNEENQFFLQYTSPKERLEGGAPFQVETRVADTKRIELACRAISTCNAVLTQRLQMDEQFNSDDDKVQINFIDGSEEYFE